MAVIEGLGTCLLVFALGAGASGLTTLQVSPMAISLYASLLNFVGLSLFIMAAAPASGGHLNPSITMATFFAGLSTLPRSVLYIVAQTLGAIVAGYWLKLGLGEQYFPVVSLLKSATPSYPAQHLLCRAPSQAVRSTRPKCLLVNYSHWNTCLL